LSVELLAAGIDREAALRHAEAALADITRGHRGDAMWVPIVITPLACAGALRRALTINEQIVAQARAAGQRPALSIGLSANAKLKLWMGDVSGAVADAEDALSHAENPIAVCFAVTFRAEAHRLRDELDLAWSVLATHGMIDSLPHLWPFPLLLAERGWIRFLRGDSDGALEDLYACGRLLLRYGLRCPAVVPWRGRTAQVLAAVGQQDRARRLANAELRAARAWGDTRTLVEALNAAAALEDGEARRELLREALARSGASEHVLPRVDALCALGAALRRQGRRREAREYLVEALHLAHEAGAFAARRTAQEELLAAGGRPRRPAARGRDALTPSETRVARLAAEGRSNPDIAQLLFVTRRTVETHLTSDYRKLGVDGRQELAEALR
jgi:ATP/maltotriose-dependent transcriptional regulator MalT